MSIGEFNIYIDKNDFKDFEDFDGNGNIENIKNENDVKYKENVKTDYDFRNRHENEEIIKNKDENVNTELETVETIEKEINITKSFENLLKIQKKSFDCFKYIPSQDNPNFQSYFKILQHILLHTDRAYHLLNDLSSEFQNLDTKNVKLQELSDEITEDVDSLIRYMLMQDLCGNRW